jgi:hypothetical protein
VGFFNYYYSLNLKIPEVCSGPGLEKICIKVALKGVSLVIHFNKGQGNKINRYYFKDVLAELSLTFHYGNTM